MNTDAHLEAWRDAAASGGLPEPGRERWQPLRAGVVNLWEFEAAEYWYADGWAQLMGRNETGKSSLMALTTLIPWLADTSSDKIDTLGRSGKQFSYYVRPTGADGDRRDASGSHFHGWLWVEYGRLINGRADFFTTLLYASARSATPRVNLEWCTSSGGRVRDSLRIAIGREIQTPKTISLPGFTVHPSAQSYKSEVADHLLGSTVDRLEIIGKILKVTRTPKLGAHLDIRFVTDHLRSSLPELRRSEIEQLAQGWDQLDQIRHDLQRTQDATDTLARFSSGPWRSWFGAKLRLAADEAADRRTKFDAVRRDEESAASVLRDAEAADAELRDRAGAAELQAETASVVADELQQSAAFRDAHERLAEARRAAEAVASLERDVAASTAAFQRAAEAREASEQEHRSREETLVGKERAADGAHVDVRRDAGAAGLPVVTPEVDVERLRQGITERRRAVGAAEDLLRGEAAANTSATLAEEKAALLAGRAADAAESAEGAWQEAEDEYTSVVDTLAAWLRDLPPPVPETTPWVDALPRSAEDLSSATLDETIRHDWYEPSRTNLAGQLHAAESALAEAVNDTQRLQAEITALESAGIAPPAAPALWQRRDRAGADGAPLWQLINPSPDLPTDALAHLEAALAAAGFLDAWVSDDAPAALDTFALAPDTIPDGRPLSSVLHVADGAGALGAGAQLVLDGIVLCTAGETLPDTGVAVATDGRWRSSGLTGSAAPAESVAEWIGEAARAAQRRRQLEDLAHQLRLREADRARHHADVVAARAALETLAEALRSAPSDRALRRSIDRASDRDTQASAARQDAEDAGSEARSARVTADVRRAELLRFTTDSGLPHDAAGLTAVRDALHVVDRTLDRLGHARQLLLDAELAAERSRADLAQRSQVLQEQRDLLTAAERALAVGSSRAEALRAAIDDEDTILLDRLEQLQREAREARALHDNLRRQREGLLERLGGARIQLANTQALRETATRERDVSFQRFRSLVDRGVVAELDLHLPEVHSSSIEHVRAQVAEVRRQVSPRRWQEAAPENNSEVLQRLRSTLENGAREVSSALETGGRSLTLEPIDDLIRIDVTVDTNGTTVPLRQAVEHLADTVTTLQDAYDARIQETLDELLGSAFLEHMRDRIGEAQNLIHDINRVLGEHATTTSGTTMRIRLSPDQNRGVLDAISGTALQNPQVQEQIRGFLRDRVDEAKRLAQDQGQAEWHDALARQLDYRDWYEVSLERRIGAGGTWSPLTARTFAEMSGGARAVMLMLPLVATLAALYRDMPCAPRPIWLDEAFDGLDAANRSMVMDLLRQFDLDVLLAGPGRLVNVRAVPVAAIYQVVRAPAPHPGADLTLELWAGGSLDVIDLPLSWLDTVAAEPDPDQAALL